MAHPHKASVFTTVAKASISAVFSAWMIWKITTFVMGY